jgi:hypothetical protein
LSDSETHHNSFSADDGFRCAGSGVFDCRCSIAAVGRDLRKNRVNTCESHAFSTPGWVTAAFAAAIQAAPLTKL